MNPRLILGVLAGSLCGLMFGYDVGAISSATPNVRMCFGLSPAALGLAVSAALLGTIVGSIAAGRLADRLGRRAAIFAGTILYAVATILASCSQQFSQFATCRFFCGAAIGLISVASPLYLAEIAPSKLRGGIVGSFQLSLSVGVVAAFLASYLVSLHVSPDMAWRLSMGAGAAPALLALPCLLRSPETPRWLALRGRVVAARAALTALGSKDCDLDIAGMAASQDDAERSDRATLFTRRNLRPIALAVSIAMFNQLTGVNAILYYILDVFKDLGSGRLNGRADAVILSSLSLIVTVIAVFVIDKVGRKPLLLVGTTGMGICLLLLMAIRNYAWPAATVVVVIACYNICFGFSQGTVIWVYLSEIFPLHVRARGQSLGSVVHWITCAFVVGTFPAIMSSLGNKVFACFALMMILQFFTVLLFYPETKGKILESSMT